MSSVSFVVLGQPSNDVPKPATRFLQFHLPLLAHAYLSFLAVIEVTFGRRTPHFETTVLW